MRVSRRSFLALVLVCMPGCQQQVDDFWAFREENIKKTEALEARNAAYAAEQERRKTTEHVNEDGILVNPSLGYRIQRIAPDTFEIIQDKFNGSKIGYQRVHAECGGIKSVTGWGWRDSGVTVIAEQSDCLNQVPVRNFGSKER